MGWCNVIRVEECRDNVRDLHDVLHYLGRQWQVVMSDCSRERKPVSSPSSVVSG